MKKLVRLFDLIQYTRSMPQYGYVLSGIRQNDLSNLAEHHYLVSFIAWQLAHYVKAKGAEINIQRVMEFGMIHDLGELFGGDIAMPYAKANPKAREYAKAFEAENHKYLSKFFGDQSEYFQQLADEIMDAKSDESIIAKLADYIEVTHYKKYMDKYRDSDVELVRSKLLFLIDQMADPISKKTLLQLITDWFEELPSLKPLNETL
jgi:5'-deoxynucleotidase YfbR-like HD superfamily hydrolase